MDQNVFTFYAVYEPLRMAIAIAYLLKQDEDEDVSYRDNQLTAATLDKLC